MGDRVVVLFAGDGTDYAAVYKHYDGSGIAEVLDEFFAAEEANAAHDNRFGDPEYLSARFVVWSSRATGTGVGIVPTNRRESTNVRVHCDGEARPRIEVLS